MRAIITILFILTYGLQFKAQSLSYSDTNIESIKNRLAYRAHSDNRATLRFQNSENNKFIATSSLQIFEKPILKLHEGLTFKDNSFSPQTNNKSLVEFEAIEGKIRLNVKENFDYFIVLKDQAYKDEFFTINWRELVQNNEVVLNLTPKKSLYLGGEISIKKVSVDLSQLTLSFHDLTNGENNNLTIDAKGHFAFYGEYGHSYTIKCGHPSGGNLSFELSIPQKNERFKSKTFKSSNFDIFIDEPVQYNTISKTPIIDKNSKEIKNSQELKTFFLGSQNIEFERGQTITLSNYKFNYDSYIFSDDCKKELDILLLLLKANPALKISIRVYTDSRGDNAYNQRLTLDIAEKMARYLSSRGIDTPRIVPFGMGESNPVNPCPESTNCTESQHLANRRAEIQIIE